MFPSVNVDICMARSHSGSLFGNNIWVCPQGFFSFVPNHFPRRPFGHIMTPPMHFLPLITFFYTWSLNYTPFVSESLFIFYDKKQVRFTNARMSGIYCITYPLLNTSLVEILALRGVNHSNHSQNVVWFHLKGCSEEMCLCISETRTGCQTFLL